VSDLEARDQDKWMRRHFPAAMDRAHATGYAEAVKDVAKLVESRWLDQASYRREILALIPGDAP